MKKLDTSANYYKSNESESLEETFPKIATSKDGSYSTSLSYQEIRLLCSILLQWPRRTDEGVATLTQSHSKVFPWYDDKNLTDQMKEEGLRLLSIAIVPIQTQARRFFAKRRALAREKALIILQSYVRLWIARKHYVQDFNSIVLLQALVRRRSLQCSLIYQHKNASKIERIFRGYQAKLKLEKTVSSIVLLQSFARMRIAREEVRYRMGLVIQLQSMARRFLIRHRQSRAAAVIQARWRGYYYHRAYKLSHAQKVIMIQCLWRKRVATNQLVLLRLEHYNQSANIIQTRWRSYWCTLVYKADLANIIIIQSRMWRQHAARRQVALLRQERHNRFATKIQTKWRSYHCRGKYKLSLQSIITIQSRVWRKRVVMTQASKLRQEKYDRCATIIQTKWRSYYCVMIFLWKFGESNTVTIQRVVRGYIQRNQTKRKHCAAAYLQAVVRKIQAANYLKKSRAARKIQSVWRKYHGKQRAIQNHAASRIQGAYRDYISDVTLERLDAALMIQKVWRRHICFVEYEEFLATREVQTMWKCHLSSDRYKKYTTATVIDNMLKSHVDLYDQHERYLAATTIQKMWRGHSCYKQYKQDVVAAIAIQETWRSLISSSEQRQVSSTVRGGVSGRKSSDTDHHSKKVNDRSSWMGGYASCLGTPCMTTTAWGFSSISDLFNCQTSLRQQARQKPRRKAHTS